MQRTLLLTAAIFVLAIPSTSQADLVAGWETWKWQGAGNNPFISNSTQQASGVTAAATQDGNWSIAPSASSNDGTFGTLGTPSASNDTAGSTSGYRLADGQDGFVDFAITAGATAYDATAFHFDTTRFRFGSAEFWSLEVLAGSAITVGVVASGELGVYNADQNLPDFDIDLTGLADSTLEANATVTFRLAYVGGNGNAAQHTYLDNAAFSGTVAAVPEPSSLALFGLAVLGLARRRNN